MSIQTLDVPKGSVLSINSELSIPVGTKMDITNESILYNVFLQESDTQPPANTDDKRTLTQRDWAGSEVLIPASSQEIWAYSPSGGVRLSVQVL